MLVKCAPFLCYPNIMFLFIYFRGEIKIHIYNQLSQLNLTAYTTSYPKISSSTDLLLGCNIAACVRFGSSVSETDSTESATQEDKLNLFMDRTLIVWVCHSEAACRIANHERKLQFDWHGFRECSVEIDYARTNDHINKCRSTSMHHDVMTPVNDGL